MKLKTKKTYLCFIVFLVSSARPSFGTSNNVPRKYFGYPPSCGESSHSQVTTTLPKHIKTILNALPSHEGNTARSCSEINDATIIVSDGEYFIIKENVISKTNDDGSVDTIRNGTYGLINPVTNVSWSGNFDLQTAIITKNSDGGICLEDTGVFYINSPDYSSTDGRGTFGITYYTTDALNADGHVVSNESGHYSLSDPTVKSARKGQFVIHNSASTYNHDGSINVVKTGVLLDDAGNKESNPDPYLLMAYDVYATPDSDGNLGNGVYNVNDLHTGDSVSGAFEIKEISTTSHSNGAIHSVVKGVIHVNSDDSDYSSSIIVDGAEFTIDENLIPVTDKYGHVAVIGNGTIRQVYPESCVIQSRSYVIRALLDENKPDGSMNVVKYGVFIDDTKLLAIDSESSSSAPVTPLKMTSESYHKLIKIAKPQTSPTEISSTSQHKKLYDATFIANTGDYFILQETIIPKVDVDGNYDTYRYGTYGLINPATNVSWSGDFKLQKATIDVDHNGNVLVKDTGVYSVNSADKASVNEGNFEINDYTVTVTNSSGDSVSVEAGDYALSDPLADISRNGKFLIHNTASKSKADGSIDVVKTGVLVDDFEIGWTSDPHFVMTYDIYAKPDAEGNLGDGVYNIIDLQTGDSLCGTLNVQQTSTIVYSNGSMHSIINGVIRVNEDDSISSSDVLSSIIVNGAEYTIDETLIPVTDEYGHVAMIGSATISQVNPTSGLTQITSYVIRATLSKENTDGSTKLIKYGTILDDTKFLFVHPLDSSADAIPVKMTSDSYQTLLDVVKPQPASSTNSDTIHDATLIADDGEYFIIQENIITKVHEDGNYDTHRYGTYGLLNPATNVSWSGSFELSSAETDVDCDGNVHLHDTGSYDVNSPSNAIFAQGTFKLDDYTVTVMNYSGDSVSVEAGDYALSDPTTDRCKNGKFLVHNTASKSKADGSIEIVKTGILVGDDLEIGPTCDPYFLIAFDIYAKPDAEGNLGDGIYNINDLQTGDSVSGTFNVQQSSDIAYPNGSKDSIIHGVIHVNDDTTCCSDDVSSIILDGARFTFEETLIPVTDKYGNVAMIGNGKISQVNPTSGITQVRSYIIRASLAKENTDGSSTVIQYGTVSNAPQFLHTDHASSTPVVVVEPHKSSSGSSEGHGVTPSSDIATRDATLIVDDGDYFIIQENLVSEVANNGKVDTRRSGMYNLLNPNSKASTSGNFAIQSASVQTDSKGDIYVSDSGVFDVTSPDGKTVVGQGNFEVNDFIPCESSRKSNSIIIEGGNYTLSDSKAETGRSGEFQVHNTVSKYNSDGSLHFVKSGVLSVDNDSEIPADDPALTIDENAAYFLFVDHIFEKPNADGIVGDGVYNIKDPRTGDSVSGNYEITEIRATDEIDGILHAITEIVIHVNDSTSSPVSDGSHTMIIDGAACIVDQYITTTANDDGSVVITGKGTFTQQDPEQSVSIASNFTIRTIVTKKNSDESTDFIKYGVIYKDSTVITTPDGTSDTSSTSVSESSVTTQISADSYGVLLNALNPINSESKTNDLTTPSSPKGISYDILLDTFSPVASSQTFDSHDQTSINQSPDYDATSIATNHADFIIDRIVVPEYDDEGNVVDLDQSGNYTIREPKTNVTWSGRFVIDECIVKVDTNGMITTKSVGKFDIDPVANQDSNTPSTTVSGSVVVESFISKVVDESGNLRITESGIFVLTDSTTGDDVKGTFVVANSVSKSNPDASINVIQTGIMYVNEPDTDLTSPVLPAVEPRGGYFMFNEYQSQNLDSRGNHGYGFYQLKDPKTNEVQTGTYVVKTLAVTHNSDGSRSSKTTGFIYVDPSKSISTTDNPVLFVVNGSRYSFDDHTTHLTDQYGHTSIVGTGVYTHTDLTTGITITSDYVIRDISVTQIDDGSVEAIKFGTYHVGDSTASNSNTQSSSAVHPQKSVTVQPCGPYVSYDINAESQDHFIHFCSSATTVTVARCDVVTAINGQQLLPGDVAIVEGDDGEIFVGYVRDNCSPIVFERTSPSSIQNYPRASRIWTIPEGNFPQNDINKFNAVAKSGN